MEFHNSCNGWGECFESHGPKDDYGKYLIWQKKSGLKCPCTLITCGRCGLKTPLFFEHRDCIAGKCEK